MSARRPDTRRPRRDRAVAIWYEVHEIMDIKGKSTGFYKLGRHNSKLNELPLIFCDHRHPTFEAARACTYFDHG